MIIDQEQNLYASRAHSAAQVDARAGHERGARERQLGAGALPRERLSDADDHVDAAAGTLEYVFRRIN